MVDKIEVNVDRQKLYAYTGSSVIREFDCVTGRIGKSTEPGIFTILRKHQKYVSKTYGARMDYAMFFTTDGKAIHQSQLVWIRSMAMVYIGENVIGPIGSHGCVGLTENDAKWLFGETPVGTIVEVLPATPPPATSTPPVE